MIKEITITNNKEQNLIKRAINISENLQSYENNFLVFS